ncbi:PQQ-dependent sugar dehydrogenase [Corallococcus interemptor]|uniref:PQQ-dependent sugar dehydrogenase n=1 Tax=Corallococcus interemptor TaxID=2316720 RepID=A0A3A8QAZ9_9BACT|nr:PQQ-dependent sugar dehydrogenase [Corallococcus interemptor]RKH52766.1 PQQ-dependent sugar dehydrogenase [Corallococcus sp. AB050B]RKH65817.1 PQQ-dependent sugar dehydrogenase [Corallococcus interemptor]
MRSRRLLLSALVVLTASASGCRRSQAQGTASAADCVLMEDGWGQDGSAPVTVDVVAEGLEVPWGVAFLPGTPGSAADALITERPGRVRLLRGGQLQPGAVATLPLTANGEGGLLGIAAHPDFATNRWFYLYVTTQADGKAQNRVERWTLSPDGTSATFERVIYGNIPSAKYHDGGRLRFGPDGMLYVGTGDSRDPDLSQDVMNPAGKLLRLTPDGAVPQDNPFPNSPAFLTGVRNTQGFDWKDATTLYVTDHGPSGETMRFGHDEVNVVKAGDNLGWPGIYSCETQAGRITPSLTFDDAAPPGGAAVYTGSAIPEWTGSLLVGTLKSKHLHRVEFDANEPRRVAKHEVYLRDTWGRLRDVLMGPDGHLYVTTSNCDGRGECGPKKDLLLRVRR